MNSSSRIWHLGLTIEVMMVILSECKILSLKSLNWRVLIRLLSSTELGGFWTAELKVGITSCIVEFFSYRSLI